MQREPKKLIKKKQKPQESCTKIILDKLEELDWKINQILPKPKK